MNALVRAATEAGLHRAIVAFLDLALPPDVVVYHVPNGELRHRAVAGRLAGLGVRAGVPDLAVIHRGRALFLEVKAPGGRLSPAQRETHAALVAAGAKLAVVRDIEDAIAALAGWGVPLRARAAA